MTTPRQIAANRLNALRSTGPRTEEGRARAKWNALKHGLTAIAPLLPDEDPGAYQALRDALYEELAPVGVLEEAYADQTLHFLWRRRWVPEFERTILEITALKRRIHNAAAAQVRSPSWRYLGPLDLLRHSEEDRAAMANTPEITGFRDQLAAVHVGPGGAFYDDAAKGNALMKLLRYSTALDRGLRLALRELERLQAKRRGPSTPAVPPHADEKEEKESAAA